MLCACYRNVMTITMMIKHELTYYIYNIYLAGVRSCELPGNPYAGRSELRYLKNISERTYRLANRWRGAKLYAQTTVCEPELLLITYSLGCI